MKTKILAEIFKSVPLMFTNSNNYNPANIYLLKLNNRITRKRWETCSKLIIKAPERRLFKGAL